MSEKKSLDVQIEEELFDYSNVQTNTAVIRKNISDKLTTVINEMVINPNLDSAAGITAKTQLINTAMQLANDMDSQKTKSIDTKVKVARMKTEDSISGTITATAIEMMKGISALPSMKTRTNETDADIDKALADSAKGIEILESETEMHKKK